MSNENDQFAHLQNTSQPELFKKFYNERTILMFSLKAQNNSFFKLNVWVVSCCIFCWIRLSYT
ncbi:hypothetical protein BpHYR1_005872 [Brachionus plicatilis]|uniref:Uncharacterized protein n=1 Tax=Brachionus plicatilis TaxID=10195 RepID=A0A3M7T9P2_BRAPC|nr:hypothetical protein BpHYR1_005872 [Brachionus plicatilis]